MDEVNKPEPEQPKEPTIVNGTIESVPAPSGVVEPTNQTVNHNPAPTSSPQKSRSKFLVVILIIVLVVAVAVGVLVWRDKIKVNVSSSGSSAKYDIPLIKFGYVNNPLNAFYPTDAAYNGVSGVQDQIFEGLVAFQGGTQIKPQLASSWTNPDQNTWIFKLKPNIYFHDGNQLTAADVVYSWQQSIKYPNGYGSFVSTVKDVKALNDSTVQITTDKPDAILLNRLTQMFILDSKAPANTGVWELGTGAYTVKQNTTPTPNTLDLVAFDKWHGGHIYTKEVDYKFYADSDQAVKDMVAGKLNLIDEILYNNVTSKLSQNFQAFKTSQAGNSMLVFNSTNPSYPTSNLKIRQALDLALNPQEILTKSQSVGKTADQLIPSTIPGSDPSAKPTQQNIAQAAALVKSAGYPNGVTVQLTVGEPVQAVGQAIVAEAKLAGINVKLDVATDEGQYFSDINSGKTQIWFETIPTAILDGSDILANFDGQIWYNNPQFSTQLDNASTTFKASDRIISLQDASTILTNDREYIPLFQEQDLNFSQKGFVFPLTDYDQDLNTLFSSVYSTKPVQ